MHIHILGICGTFMGSLAILAKQTGYRVTGCDIQVYPPMSTQLRAQGIELIEGFETDQLALQPNMFVVGNVISRGNPLMEAILDRGLSYCSGPEWISKTILYDKWVLAVAGTHGKTTTAAMLAWILESAGYHTGFLIGGIACNFGVSARLPTSKHTPSFFVIEADEYDTSFFDKRSKFVHYHPKTLILNNLEYDHADIFPDLAAIETQFHHLIRTVPSIGRLIINAQDEALQRVLAQGCWSEKAWFSMRSTHNTNNAHDNLHGKSDEIWQLITDEDKDNPYLIDILMNGSSQGSPAWPWTGAHNHMNALAAIAAAYHVGVPVSKAMAGLNKFAHVKRRMEWLGNVKGIDLYDDFAHHPTAIAATLAGCQQMIKKNGPPRRLIAVFEPRSNTMKLGQMKNALVPSLQRADLVFGLSPPQITWDVPAALAALGKKAHISHSIEGLIAMIVHAARPGDIIVVMSNGNFGEIHQKLLLALQQ